MRPREPIFALDYIRETVRLYAAADNLEPDEARWARDVLALYFRSVGSHPVVDDARLKFEGLVTDRIASDADRWGDKLEQREQVPYRAESRASLTVGYQALLQLVQRRRSIRWFLPRSVSRELIARAVGLAREAPSACNRQAYHFRFFESPADAQEIASIAMGTSGYSQQIPALIVVIGDWSCLAEERDRHIPYIDGALAAMQFMLACETLGLGTCAINWPDVEILERRMDRALDLPVYQRPVMLIAVGYPDPEGGVARSTKKPVGDLLR